MSTDKQDNPKEKSNNNYNIDKKRSGRSNNKLALIAGILGLALLAATLISSQLSSNTAIAQSSSNSSTANSTAPATSSSSDNNNSNKSVIQPYNYQQHQNFERSSSTISTSGTASTKVTPDKFSVTAGVETNGATAQEAALKNADLMAKVIAALKDLGVKENQISTNNYNVYPVYDTKPMNKMCIDIYPQPPECQPKQEIVGYRASNSITVTLDVKGSVDAGKVIDTMVKAGVNNVNGVYFFVSQEMQQQIRDNLIKDAIANARHRADIAADALGTFISGVQSINLNEVYFPIYAKSYNAEMMQTPGAPASQPTQLLPGEQEVSTSVSAVFYMGGGHNDSGNNSSAQNETSVAPGGMLRTRDNTNCTNPPNGPMIC